MKIKIEKLKEKEIKRRLKFFKNWNYKENYLVRFLKLKDFVSAVKFINDILPIAESLNHHPDIEIKNYNEVTIKITTHDVGGVTEYDFQLAEKIENIISSLKLSK
jgi:4a-hydroxytetrahydrobiopterin dehydratase